MTQVVLETRPLGFPWSTADPFLFCVHHLDAYPEGDAGLGPAASLAGRTLGRDFDGRGGWRMYHGHEIPGFPEHPHRGFETVTIVRTGYVDHSDSLGASGRYGQGDVQWMTAGAGIVHAEMFPLLRRDAPNPLELFQIWLNLPRESKLVEPHYSMFWSESVPRYSHVDDDGRATVITIVAGQFGEQPALAPPPNSWASRRDADVAIWTVRMQSGARITLPAAANPRTVRTLYFFVGDRLIIADQPYERHGAYLVRADGELELRAPNGECEVLLLQGCPIAEPVVQYGPFVMNSAAEIQQAFDDYRRTGFGGWPWPQADPVHARDAGRFARYADGRTQRP
jgi:redox-sensitive bicupin YhaK (pirin superfamily)